MPLQALSSVMSLQFVALAVFDVVGFTTDQTEMNRDAMNNNPRPLSSLVILLAIFLITACSNLMDGGREEIDSLPGGVKYTDFTSSVPDLYAAASDLLEEGEYSEAEALYRQIIAAEPEIPHSYVGLGASLFYQDRLTEALEAYIQATQLSPMTPHAFIGLGSTFYSLGDCQSARQAYAAAVDLDEMNADAHLGMGMALGELEHYDTAVMHLERFLELAPDSQQRTSVLALIAEYRSH